ncbi:hypothetical protein RDI58_000470 [Solanum bulbocastanum]|uniref:Uncharacterized protein n=1 Tax=Solanum bulbocastanum TaxID=147425 RepID=A0AAN8U1F9_SOLBU
MALSTTSHAKLLVPIHSIYIELPIPSKNAKNSSLIPEEKSEPKTLISKSQEQSHSKPNSPLLAGNELARSSSFLRCEVEGRPVVILSRISP